MSLRDDILALFPDAKPGTGYMRCRCPFHGNGQERHPSMSILTEPKGVGKDRLEPGFAQCFIGDTDIFTRSGIFKIRDILNKPVQILNGKGVWETTVFRSYGYSPVVELHLTRNLIKKTIFTTPNHLWFRIDRINPVQTTKLKPGCTLREQWFRNASKQYTLLKDGILHGFIYGDGRYDRTLKGGPHSTVGHIDCPGLRVYSAIVYDVKKELPLLDYPEYKKFSQPKRYSESYLPELGCLTVHSYRDLKRLPTLEDSLDYWFSFIAGYFLADGCVPTDGAPVIESSKKDDLQFIAFILQLMGIPTTGVTESKVRAIYASSVVDVPIGTPYYRLCLPRNQISNNFWLSKLKRPSSLNAFQKLRWTVESIVTTDRVEEVFCCETSTQSFVLSDNILTHNCFACGWKGDFSEIAENFGLQYIPETYTLAPTEQRRETPLKLTTQQAVYKKDTPYRYSPYLASRGIFEQVQKEYRVYEKAEDGMVYLPVFSKTGQFLYANSRSASHTQKFFSIPTGIKKSLAGIDLIDFSKPIGIVESQINMYTLAQAQYVRAVATLGVANVLALSAIKNATGPFLLMLDGDDAGKKATEKIKSYLGPHRCIVYKFEEGEDVNDLWQKCNFNQDLFFDELDKRQQ